MEYRNRIRDMEDLVTDKRFQEALSVADTINWRKVHNINDLIIGSEAYEAAGQLEEARDLLLLAHERSPIGRMIIYKLCMVSVKLKDIGEAQEYYNQFVKIAPHDSLKYILKYNICVAKGSDNATLIKILEQLKEQDFLEEWAYELAYLYHKTNQANKCVDLCDEIVLWFGDGPVVERTLELKMLYQPLDKKQENTYRHLQKGDGITEITADDKLNSGEIITNTITIPQVEISAEKYNTINLQAEIKKNIDEIMKATEKGAVSENMEAIKSLVEEIPYLQVKEADPKELETEEFSVNDTFQAYLEEGSDGQMSLLLPEESSEDDDQIEGQMTIDDVMAEWERTRKAAEAAIEEAKAVELENAKAKALMEANSVLDRLEDVMIQTGVEPQQIINTQEEAQEIAANEPAPEEKSDESVQEQTEEQEIQEEYIPSLEDYTSGFAIPKLNSEGEEEGSVEIPRVKLEEEEPEKPEDEIADEIVENTEEESIEQVAEEDTLSWQPPVLDEKEETEEVDYKEASMMIADVNKLLQQEIDRLTGVPAASGTVTNAVIPEPEEIKVDEIQFELQNEVDEEPIEEPEEEQIQEYVPEVIEEPEEEEIGEPELEISLPDLETEAAPIDVPQEPEVEFTLPEIELPADLFADDEVVNESPEPEIVEEELVLPQIQDIMLDTDELKTESQHDDLPQIEQEVLSDNDMARLVDEKVLSNVIKNEVPTISLEEEDLATFSYFLSLNGMKDNIIQVLTGAAENLSKSSAKGGNIAIVGDPGSGKTQMATSIIKVLQRKTGKPEGGVGKISGEKLNEKDIQKLYSKIQGGCLIIEDAGDISKETAVTLSLMMEHDKNGTIIIIEDTKKGINKALGKDSSFARRFTEKIVIPVFSIDELVAFAKAYGNEIGYSIDEMGVLALYNRINAIARYDHAATIKEVAEIMDEAIHNSQKGGLFKKTKYDDEHNVILREKDFDK